MKAGLKKEAKGARVFVISGPSGSGKTTLARRILADKRFKNKLARSVSFTTRPKRSGEVNGKDYFFISAEEFKKNLRQKKILEWTRYLGYYYGTARRAVDDQIGRGKGVVLCLDLKGAARVKKLYPGQAVTIFVMPPSMEELAGRIHKRCSQTQEEEIRKRLSRAKEEIRAFRRYDYSLVNRDLTKAVKQLKGIIIKNFNSVIRRPN
ncbi:MAG: guanylate kinase [Candidatus Omnitrophica bacterium]|jgi:guanylate kinase|nr:guanylate kinase [Candidatus Omnitrophota bacterium]MDD5080032.1 guanylate kinase [Candidatus Omnitrophota bacterium]